MANYRDVYQALFSGLPFLPPGDEKVITSESVAFVLGFSSQENDLCQEIADLYNKFVQQQSVRDFLEAIQFAKTSIMFNNLDASHPPALPFVDERELPTLKKWLYLLVDKLYTVQSVLANHQLPYINKYNFPIIYDWQKVQTFPYMGDTLGNLIELI